MIDLSLLRDDPDLVKRSQQARGHAPESVDQAIEADRERRAALTAFEELRAAQNAFGKMPDVPTADLQPDQVIDEVFDFAEKMLEGQRDFAKKMLGI